MTRLLSVLLYSTVLLTLAYAHPSNNPGCPCSDIQVPTLPGTQIVSLNRTVLSSFNITKAPPLLHDDITVPPICEVIIKLTHLGVNDTVTTQVWLPQSNWNGRFVALGGSGWAAGHGPLTLGPAVIGGFAAANTDAGVDTDPSTPASWTLKEDGSVNLGLLTNFASRSVYEMAVLGKSVAESFYRKKPTTYWNGCSTGGRQGLVAAQQYPEVFDGILAGAPAIYWPTYVMAELWPQVVMKEAAVYPSLAQLNAVVAAAVQTCDELDGVKDNVISEPDKCDFDPASAVGTVVVEGEEVEITPEVSSIVKKIWEGPIIDGQKLWYGLPIGSPLDDLANTSAFFVPSTWTQFFLKQVPDFNVSALNSQQLKGLFLESQLKYDDLLNNADPDLSDLQRSRGKLIVWHGAADPIIFPQGSTQYRQRVEEAMGGGTIVDEFFRYFLAPGVDHCGLGTTPGARPASAFEALIAWVEKGATPEYLDGATPPPPFAQFTRKICRYPSVEKYRGSGDPTLQESFDCVES